MRVAVDIVALVVAGLFMLFAVSPAAATMPDRTAELRVAAGRGDLAVVERHIRGGIPLDAKDHQGQTALLLAVAGGHTAVAKALIDAGANINAVAANKDTPWLLAGARGHAAMLEHMLTKGPDYTLRNRFGGNPLIPACERGHVEAVKVLLKSKVAIDHVNNLGWTCLLEIVILSPGGPRDLEVTRLVLDAGANPNIADKDGVTPLAHARRRGFTGIAKLIAAKGGR